MTKLFQRLTAFIAVTMVLTTCAPTPDSPTPPAPGPPAYNWTDQHSLVSEQLNDVFFVNNNLGWVVGESLTLLSTNDGGTSWPAVPSTSIVRDLKSAFFVDEKTGWFTSGKETIPKDGHIFVTHMGGAYPTEQKAVNRPLYSVFFLNKMIGWAAGDSSIFLHTTDGGTNWDQTAIGVKLKIFDLQFFTPEIGWAATSNAGIYRTKDGTTWSKEELGVTADIHALYFADTLHGWACGSQNTVLRRVADSTGKLIWTSTTIQGEPAGTIWNDIFFIGELKGWIAGTDGNIYKTTDGGVNWIQETSPVHSNLNGIHMANATRGWAVGDDGTILTYTP